MQVYGKITIELGVTITMSEGEARALDALLGYDTEKFLEVFYDKMGRSYLEPHEPGFRELVGCRDVLRRQLDRLNAARRAGQVTLQ